MVNMRTFTLLATAVISSSAVELKFKRFADQGCHEAFRIHSDVDLHDDHCKSFSDHEVPFSSFTIVPHDDTEDFHKKNCYAIVYDGEDCTGSANQYENMEAYSGKCENTKGKLGRSVRIQCDELAEPKPTMTTTTWFKPATVDHWATATSWNTVTENKVTTMMAVPKVVSTMMAVPKVAVPYVGDDEFDWCPDYDHHDDHDEKKMRKVKRGTPC